MLESLYWLDARKKRKMESYLAESARQNLALGGVPCRVHRTQRVSPAGQHHLTSGSTFVRRPLYLKTFARLFPEPGE